MNKIIGRKQIVRISLMLKWLKKNHSRSLNYPDLSLGIFSLTNEVAQDILMVLKGRTFALFNENLSRGTCFANACRACTRWNGNDKILLGPSAFQKCLARKRNFSFGKRNFWIVPIGRRLGKSWWKPYKATQKVTVGGQYYSSRILLCTIRRYARKNNE